MKKSSIEDVILFQIDKTLKIVKQYSQREFDKLELGITVEQWVLLKIIEESESLSQKELATISHRDPASITRTLNLLEEKQLIRREPIENNKRQYNISLTNSGAAFVQNNMQLIQGHRTRSTKGFSEKELKTLSDMLMRIQQNME